MEVISVIYFLYHLVWSVASIIFSPFLVTKKGRDIFKRLYLPLPDGNRNKRIWIHALSVGEVISAFPLIDSINKQYPAKKIVLTVKTSQGMGLALERLGTRVDRLLQMPFDFWWSTERLVHAINPYLFILVESDLWPGLISYLKKRDIKIVLVNGRVSPRTFRAYGRFRALVRDMVDKIDLCLMQSNIDRDRFLSLGLQPEKVITSGNIKFDQAWPDMDEKEFAAWSERLGLSSETRVLVAGSTHPGEDEIILDTFRSLLSDFPGLRLVIAPRRLEWVEDVCRLGMIKGLKTRRRTDSGPPSYQVMVVDTIGELSRIYGLAEIAFLGGSMVPVGGHNLLEPAAFGCPVLFGKHTYNFLQMSELLIDAGGGIRVENREELLMNLKELLSDSALSRRMGKNAKDFVKKNSGALERVMNYIGCYLDAA